MAPSVQKFREIVFQLLYSLDFDNSDLEEVGSMVMRQFLVPRTAVRQAQEKVHAIWNLKEELDEKIGSRAKEYSLERLPRVELTLLRLGIYEMLHSDLPPKVAMSEAIRLARKFATAEGASFVNGVLDNIYQEFCHEARAEHSTI